LCDITIFKKSWYSCSTTDN